MNSPDALKKANEKSERNARYIDAVLDGTEGLYGSGVLTPEGQVFLISDTPDAASSCISFLDQLPAFQKKYVARPGYRYSRGDCENMAKGALQPWTRDGETEQRAPLADGILHHRTAHQEHPLLEFDIHFMDYRRLPDGSIMAFDLTAEYNIDKNAGNYRALAIRAKDESSLFGILGKVFPGTWSFDSGNRPISHFIYE